MEKISLKSLRGVKMNDGTYLSVFVPRRVRIEEGDIIKIDKREYVVISISPSTDFYNDVGVSPVESCNFDTKKLDKDLVDRLLDSCR